MTDLAPTIVPKSDQLNSDDLIGRNLTIKVTQVSILAGDQPVAVHYEGDEGKPYKPCKSMRRLMVMIWGGDGSAFVGRSMTLYRDESVKFGSDLVGGIRISHMSHIDREITLPLTVTRGRRKPYTVLPLATPDDGSLQCERMNLSAVEVKFLTPYAEAKGITVREVADGWDSTKKELAEHVKAFYREQKK